MKNIIVFALLLFGFMSNSQTSNKLDEKNGFREFKFGDTYSKWEAQLELIETTNEKSSYNYKGNCCESFMGVKIDGIALEFSNNKLNSITIVFDNNNSSDVSIKLNEYSKIKDKIIEDMGEPIKVKKDANTGKIDSYWLGQNVAMDLSSQYRGYKEGILNLLIICTYKNKKSDGF